MGRTVKGSAADVVNGLNKTIQPEFESLVMSVGEWKARSGGMTAALLLKDAASRFKASCDLLADAVRVYGHFPAKDDEDIK